MVRQNLPEAFKERYGDCIGIIDCSEFELQAPTSFSLQGMSYSDYKERNTVKALFGITPDGYFSHVSDLYPGSKNDNDFTLSCGLLDRCPPSVALMADKGFTVSETELQRRGIRMVRPSFFSKDERASKSKVIHTKHVANIRIYAENAIGRLRYHRILNHRIPISFAHLANQMVQVCVFLTNLSAPLAK